MSLISHLLRPPAICAWLLAILCLLISCSEERYPTAQEISGVYLYEFKTGQVEVWSLSEDFGYRQQFFDDRNSYRTHASPRYTREGRWLLEGRNIIFAMPLNFYDYGQDGKPLVPPETTDVHRGIWLSAGPNAGKIALGEDIGYILSRADERNPR